MTRHQRTSRAAAQRWSSLGRVGRRGQPHQHEVCNHGPAPPQGGNTLWVSGGWGRAQAARPRLLQPFARRLPGHPLAGAYCPPDRHAWLATPGACSSHHEVGKHKVELGLEVVAALGVLGGGLGAHADAHLNGHLWSTHVEHAGWSVRFRLQPVSTSAGWPQRLFKAAAAAQQWLPAACQAVLVVAVLRVLAAGRTLIMKPGSASSRSRKPLRGRAQQRWCHGPQAVSRCGAAAHRQHLAGTQRTDCSVCPAGPRRAGSLQQHTGTATCAHVHRALTPSS